VTLFLLLLMMDDDGGYVVWNIPYHRFFTIKKQVSYWLCFPICEGFGHK
jgi:glutamate mutase epsilon subunit